MLQPLSGLLAAGCSLLGCRYDFVVATPGSTALHIAARRGSMPLVEMLLRHYVRHHIRSHHLPSVGRPAGWVLRVCSSNAGAIAS